MLGVRTDFSSPLSLSAALLPFPRPASHVYFYKDLIFTKWPIRNHLKISTPILATCVCIRTRASSICICSMCDDQFITITMYSLENLKTPKQQKQLPQLAPQLLMRCRQPTKKLNEIYFPYSHQILYVSGERAVIWKNSSETQCTAITHFSANV